MYELIHGYLEACRNHNVKLNAPKFEIGTPEIRLLGRVVSGGKIAIDTDRIDVIKNTTPPHDQKTLCSFVGFVMWLAQFIPNVETYLEPLRAASAPGVNFARNDEA